MITSREPTSVLFTAQITSEGRVTLVAHEVQYDQENDLAKELGGGKSKTNTKNSGLIFQRKGLSKTIKQKVNMFGKRERAWGGKEGFEDCERCKGNGAHQLSAPQYNLLQQLQILKKKVFRRDQERRENKKTVSLPGGRGGKSRLAEKGHKHRRRTP